MTDYADFLARKALVDPMTGLADIPPLNEALFPFQRDITAWALRRGRAALFAGTGLGKSLMELAYASAVIAETKRPLIHFAPLAVTAQMIREAAKFGVENVVQVDRQSGVITGCNVTNYQKIEHFDLKEFGGVVLDEAGILKSFDGHYRNELISRCSSIPFRLAATATPAPNDFMELGNHAEFLGVMRYTDMLATFFVHDGGDTKSWRLKGHAENDFWRWMASWSVMLRKPSDLGYPDDGYDLPPLVWHQHTVRDEAPPAGMLFAMPATTLSERLGARRDTLEGRCQLAASLTPEGEPAVWWCNLNAESELLAKLIPGAVEIRGSDSEEDRERKLLDFSEGRIQRVVTKGSIAAHGLNWQHCAWTCYVGLNDSFEQLYQSVRRFWRFGQARPVHAHMIAGEREGATVANLKRKEIDADRMAVNMVRHMADLSSLAVRGQLRDRPTYNPTQRMIVPEWLTETA